MILVIVCGLVVAFRDEGLVEVTMGEGRKAESTCVICGATGGTYHYADLRSDIWRCLD